MRAEQFGWRNYAADASALLSRSRDHASLTFWIASGVEYRRRGNRTPNIRSGLRNLRAEHRQAIVRHWRPQRANIYGPRSKSTNQHAGDTGRSHLADRYFLRALHRGWPLHGQPDAQSTKESRAPGRPNFALGGVNGSAGTTIQRMSGALWSRSRDAVAASSDRDPKFRTCGI
jgi:hypothetical protein